jgi:hypothetical protein
LIKTASELTEKGCEKEHEKYEYQEQPKNINQTTAKTVTDQNEQIKKGVKLKIKII